MGAASTVSRLPVTVKVVPLSSNEEESGGEQQQQQGEQEEDVPQQQSSQTHTEDEASQTGRVFVLYMDFCRESNWSHRLMGPALTVKQKSSLQNLQGI